MARIPNGPTSSVIRTGCSISTPLLIMIIIPTGIMIGKRTFLVAMDFYLV